MEKAVSQTGNPQKSHMPRADNKTGTREEKQAVEPVTLIMILLTVTSVSQ